MITIWLLLSHQLLLSILYALFTFYIYVIQASGELNVFIDRIQTHHQKKLCENKRQKFIETCFPRLSTIYVYFFISAIIVQAIFTWCHIVHPVLSFCIFVLLLSYLAAFVDVHVFTESVLIIHSFFQGFPFLCSLFTVFWGPCCAKREKNVFSHGCYFFISHQLTSIFHSHGVFLLTVNV